MAWLTRVTFILLACIAIGLNPHAAHADDPAGLTGVAGKAESDYFILDASRSTASETRDTFVAPRVLTSYQPVCDHQKLLLQGAASALAEADVCHRSSSICATDTPGPLTAVWIMKAPSVPPPGADDWVNTGVITCISQRKTAPKVVVSQEDFRRLPIPAPEIVTQPPDRVTLINIETTILTVKRPVLLPATVLGQPVRVRATPSRYAWRYGDGGQLVTPDPGALYPQMPTAHVYTVPGTYTVQLSTTFTGEFSVAGGPWQPITGTAIASSYPVAIQAQERRAVLIS